MTSRLRDERGFTLVELLVTMSVGMVVVGAAFALVTITANASKRVNDRVDATQRSRSAMDQIVQQLRGATCVAVPGAPAGAAPAPAIVEAGPTAVVFHADLDADRDFDPVQRRIEVVGNQILAATGPISATSSTSVAAGGRVLADPIVDPPTPASFFDAAGAAVPVFRYWTLPASGSTLVEAGGVVAAADLPRIARIDVAFAARPTEAAPAGSAVPVASSVYPRAGREGQIASLPATFAC